MKGAWKSPFALVALATAIFACQTQESATEQGSETSPAVDAAAVREAIAAKDKAFADAIVAADVEPIMLQYAADATVMPPGAPRLQGAEAIRETFTTWLEEAPPSAMSLTPDDVTVAASGDYAIAEGTYSMSGAGPDGAEWTDTGKYLVVWQNVDGDWKIVSDIWNSDAPMPGTTEATEDAAP